MEKLKIYQSGLNLVQQIYDLINANKKLANDWSLSDQIKRASVSVVANIAEGYLRSRKQFRNYLKIASGSANEVVALLQVINKVHEVDTRQLQSSYNILAKQMSAFSRSIRI